MSDEKPTPPEPSPASTDKGDAVHKWPEVKPLVDKAGAEKVPHQGSMKTGADTVGGGGTKPFVFHPEEAEAIEPPKPKSNKD